MNFEQFQELLSGILDEQRSQQSTAFIEELKSTQYPVYIQFLLQTMAAYLQGQINPILCKLSITLTLREVQSKLVLSDPELASYFLNTFPPMVTEILNSNLEDNFKKNVATILALLHVYIYHENQNVSIPQYLLIEFNRIPNLRRYWIYCISEIAVNDSTFGGFSMEDLYQILVTDFENPQLYIPKIHLFFSMAKEHPEIEQLHTLLPAFLDNCPPNQIEDLLTSLSMIAEATPSFIERYVQQLVPIICTIAKNAENPETTRNQAMFCFASIAAGNPEMCQSTEAFYAPVFETLIQIASEIDDDAPWEYDVNNINPYQCALDSLGYIFSSFDDCKIYEPIHQLAVHLLNSQISWQGAFAVISALAELNSIIYSRLFESADLQAELYSSVAQFLTPESHPRVRNAVYNFISRLSLNGTLNPVFPSSHILIDNLIPLMFSDNFEIDVMTDSEVTKFYIKKRAYEAFSNFISQLTGPKNSEYLNEILPHLERELLSGQPEFIINVTRVIGQLIKAAREDGVQYIYHIVTILKDLITRTEDFDCRAEIFYCFSLVSVYYYKITDQSILDNFRAIAFEFLDQAIPLLDICQDETIIEHLYQSIYTIIAKFGTPSEQHANELLQKMIVEAKKEINIQRVPIYETESTYSNRSVYLKIPSDDPAFKQYVSTNEVKDVSHALLILDGLLYAHDNPEVPTVDIEPHLAEIQEIVNYWITNDFQIEPLQKASWTILQTLVTRADHDFCPYIIKYFNEENKSIFSPEEVQFVSAKIEYCKNLFVYIYDCYAITAEKNPSSYFLSIIVNVINVVIKISRDINWFDPEVISKYFNTLPDTIANILEMKRKKCEKMVAFQGSVDNSNTEISHIDTCLTRISDSIVSCYKLNTEIVQAFYAQAFEPKIEEYLGNDNTLSFGLTLATTGAIINENREQMLQLIALCFKYANDFQRTDDVPCDALFAIGRLCKHLPFKPEEIEICQSIIASFQSYFEKPEFNVYDNEEMYNYSDYAVVAASKLLQANMGIIPHVDVADYLLQLPSMEDIPPDSHVYFDLLAQLISDGAMFEADDTWPETSLGGIISGFSKEQYEERTEEMLREAIKYRLQFPQEKVAILTTVQKLPDARREMFERIMRGPQQVAE